MTASMFQGEGNYQDVVKGSQPRVPMGMTPAMVQGSTGQVMSDLQTMMMNEQKQHQDEYEYANGHNDGSAPLGQASF